MRYITFGILFLLLMLSVAMAAAVPPTVVSTLKSNDIITKGPRADVRAFGNISSAKSYADANTHVLYVPAGNYSANNLSLSNIKVILDYGAIITSGRVTLGSNVTIEGPPGAVWKMRDGNNDHLLYAQGQSGILLNGFTVDGNKANQSAENSPVMFDTVSNSEIRNLTVTNAYGSDEDTTHVNADSSLSGITVKNCSGMQVNNANVNNSRRSGLMVIGPSTSQVNIRGGNFSNNGYSGVVTSNAPGVTGTGITAWNNGVDNNASNLSINGRYNSFSNFNVGGATAHGVNIGHDNPNLDASYSTIGPGVSQNNQTFGVTTLGGTQRQVGIVIQGVTSANNVKDAFKLIGSDNWTLSNCTGYGSTASPDAGLRTSDVNNGTVIGGMFTGNYYGIFFDGTSNNNRVRNVQITGNTGNVYDLGAGDSFNGNNVLAYSRTSNAVNGATAGDQVIYTYTIPANTLTSNVGIRISCYGQNAGTGSKTVYVKIGGSSVLALTASAAGSWIGKVDWYYNGATNSQKYTTFSMLGTTVNSQGAGTTALDATQPLNLQLIGNIGTGSSSDTVTGWGWRVEFLPDVTTN